MHVGLLMTECKQDLLHAEGREAVCETAATFQRCHARIVTYFCGYKLQDSLQKLNRWQHFTDTIFGEMCLILVAILQE